MEGMSLSLRPVLMGAFAAALLAALAGGAWHFLRLSLIHI